MTEAELDALLEAGALDADTARAAFEVLGSVPTAESWRRFLSGHLLMVGVVLVGVGVIIFFAANWQALPYMAKELILLSAITACAVLAGQLGTDSTGGRATALLAGILVGPALAVYGQHYQTGADPWELFWGWALLLLPFTWVARFPGAWVFELLLVQLTWGLYRSEVAMGSSIAVRDTLFALSSMALWAGALVLWEMKARGGARAWAVRWGPRLLASFWAGFAAVTAVARVVENDLGGEDVAVVVAAAVSAAVLMTVWRRRWRDLFMLAVGGALAVSVATVLLGRLLFAAIGDLGAVFLLGMALLGQVAALAMWLRKMRDVGADPA